MKLCKKHEKNSINLSQTNLFKITSPTLNLNKKIYICKLCSDFIDVNNQVNYLLKVFRI